MSIGRRLAEKYSKKDISKSDMVVDKLKDYGLISVLPFFGKSFKKISDNDDFYNVCRIFSANTLDESQINSLKEKFEVPANVETNIYVDENVLGGTIIYYQGKKWNDSVRDKLNRFNEM
jgi:F0F1-type ATP synthase delta subunit